MKKVIKSILIKLVCTLFIVSFINKRILGKIDNTKNKDLIAKHFFKKLNIFTRHRKPKYIIFCDYFLSKYCTDINAFTLFEYYLKQNINNVYYIINEESELYQSLREQNRTNNLIIINLNNNIYDILFHYFLNSQILVLSYVIYDFLYIINNVPYLKLLYINHGITYFKTNFISSELRYVRYEKRNIITSSPYEYNIFINKFNYSSNYVYKAGLARYDKYETISVNNSEKECILITFTYRLYNNSLYENSLYKKNLEKLLNNKLLINHLKKNNIDLIYIPHHNELFLNKSYEQNNFYYAKIKGQNNLTYYIRKCSLLITDLSSISFAFMYLKKPILYYLIDYNDSIKFHEKKCLDPNNKLYFGNSFLSQTPLIKKIKYYTRRKFKINKILVKKYNNVFYYRKNISEKIFNIINKLIMQ